MTRKQKRGLLIGGGVAVLAVAAILVMFALRDTVVFFQTPSDVIAQKVEAGQRFRLGGLVAQGSVKRGAGRRSNSPSPIRCRRCPLRTRASCRTCSAKGRAW